MAAGDGLISMTPTSIAYSGTSASINADGGVDFSAVTSLSLNGVFTGDYDNYLAVLFCSSSANTGIEYRWRVSGADNSTANSYVRQYLSANGSTVSGARVTGDKGAITVVAGTLVSGAEWHIYGVSLAQPTASRSITGYDSSSARIQDEAITHNQSTAYDGFTMFTNGATMTGNIHVFGYEE